MKVLLGSLHMNCHVLGFHLQTSKLETYFKINFFGGLTLAFKGALSVSARTRSACVPKKSFGEYSIFIFNIKSLCK